MTRPVIWVLFTDFTTAPPLNSQGSG